MENILQYTNLLNEGNEYKFIHKFILSTFLMPLAAGVAAEQINVEFDAFKIIINNELSTLRPEEKLTKEPLVENVIQVDREIETLLQNCKARPLER